MAEKERVLAYDHMQKQLDISSVRELEDLIIDSIYSNLITGKMNQSQGRLSVSSFIGRDVRMEEIGDIIQKLQAFKNMCSQQVNSIVDCSKQVRDQREMMEYQQASVIESVNRNKEDIKAAYLAASANIARSGVIGGGGRFV